MDELKALPFFEDFHSLLEFDFMNGAWWMDNILYGLAFSAFFALVGFLRERAFEKRLEVREAELNTMPLFPDASLNDFMVDGKPVVEALGLVQGNIVLSRDVFRTILISLKKLFGGNVGGLQRLTMLARRDALIRLKEEAFSMHAKAVINVRIETINISQKGPARIEMVAYGTAVG
jgi:uncharacterized protein YbjQ (UPF0145 family)